jgi:hypothetical protein
MLEYILFHEQSLNRFVEWLEQHSIPHQNKNDEMGLVVAVPDDLSDELTDTIDTYYEELLADTESLLADEGETLEKHAAAISVRLTDGRTIEASAPPDILKRVLSVITVEELEELVNAIARGIETPDDRPFCQR